MNRDPSDASYLFVLFQKFLIDLKDFETMKVAQAVDNNIFLDQREQKLFAFYSSRSRRLNCRFPVITRITGFS